MPQFIHAVPKQTQAIFLEASATLPKSSLYSNKALFSEQITYIKLSASTVRGGRWTAIKGEEGDRKELGPRKGGCEDEA